MSVRAVAGRRTSILPRTGARELLFWGKVDRSGYMIFGWGELEKKEYDVGFVLYQ